MWDTTDRILHLPMVTQTSTGNLGTLDPLTALNGSIALPLSSRPKRTRISYLAVLAPTTDAGLRKERRTRFISATKLRKRTGGAEWMDLLFRRSH